VRGLRLIGADVHAKLMEQANAVYAKEQTRQAKRKRKGTIEAFRESYEDSDFNELDDAFDDLTEDLYALRIRYIRDHPEEFKS
jgi:hypothetical protein